MFTASTPVLTFPGGIESSFVEVGKNPDCRRAVSGVADRAIEYVRAVIGVGLGWSTFNLRYVNHGSSTDTVIANLQPESASVSAKQWSLYLYLLCAGRYCGLELADVVIVGGANILVK